MLEKYNPFVDANGTTIIYFGKTLISIRKKIKNYNVKVYKGGVTECDKPLVLEFSTIEEVELFLEIIFEYSN